VWQLEFEQWFDLELCNDTRWEGICIVLEKLTKCKEALIKLANDDAFDAILDSRPTSDFPNDMLESSYWARMDAYYAVFVSLRIASREAQSLSHPTASRVLYQISVLKVKLTSDNASDSMAVKELKANLLKSLNTRCATYFTDVTNALKAALVDPIHSRHVGSYGVPSALIEKGWTAIVDDAVFLTSCVSAEDDFEELAASSSEDSQDQLDIQIRAALQLQATTLRKGLNKVPVLI